MADPPSSPGSDSAVSSAVESDGAIPGGGTVSPAFAAAPAASATGPVTAATVPASATASAAAPAASAPAAVASAAASAATAAVDSSIDARLNQSKNLLDASKQALADEVRRRETDDRSTIAKTIVNVFVWLMVGLVVAVTVGTSTVDGWAKWKDAAEFMLKALSSVLLPVVTLVIGYYFGKEKQ